MTDFSKVKWQKIEDLDGAEGDDVIWDYRSKEKGEVLMGILQEVRKDVGPNNSQLYTFENKDGRIKVWGCLLLDRLLSSVKIGEKVKIVYGGKEVSEKTKRPYYVFDIFHEEGSTPTSEAVDPDDIPF